MTRVDAFSGFMPSDAGVRGQAHDGAFTAAGQMDGQTIQLDAQPSLLGSAAQEVGMYLADKVEAKRISERKKEPLKAPARMRPEEAKAYLASAQPELDLGGLARSLLGSPQAVKQFLRHTGNSPSEQYAALQYTLSQGEQDGASEAVQDELRAALGDLERQSGAQIRADLNTHPVAADGSKSPEDFIAFQKSYRDIALGTASLSEALKSALERLGETDFESGLQRLIAALGMDLASARPSADPVRLSSVVHDLYQMQVLSTLLVNARNLLHSLEQQFGAIHTDASKLMSALVGISAEKWNSASRFETLANDFGATETLAQIRFLSGVKGLLRDLPVQLFPDESSRADCLGAFQEALDNAIDKEDERT